MDYAKIEKKLKMALDKGHIKCCGLILEPDYYKCPKCGKINILIQYGLI